MKNDQYFKHDATAANSSKLVLLLETEGARGYGIYWLLIEAIRMQSNFCISFSLLQALARRCRTRMDVVLRVVHNYDLFVVEKDHFFSPGLNRRLRNFSKSSGANVEQTARSQNDKQQTVSEIPTTCAHVEEKRREEEKRNCSSSKEKPAVAATVFLNPDSGPVSIPLPRCGWEELVNEMAADQSWMELTGMRSGLGQLFRKNSERVIAIFKEHIRRYAKEDDMLWLKDVKQYFANYMAMGSRTCRLLRERLQEEALEQFRAAEPNPYETLVNGQRTYLGHIISPDAPPRPHAAAVWVAEVGRWER